MFYLIPKPVLLQNYNVEEGPALRVPSRSYGEREGGFPLESLKRRIILRLQRAELWIVERHSQAFRGLYMEEKN